MRVCNKCKKPFDVGVTFDYKTKTKGKKIARLCSNCCASFVVKIVWEKTITTRQLFEYANPK